MPLSVTPLLKTLDGNVEQLRIVTYCKADTHGIAADMTILDKRGLVDSSQVDRHRV